MTTARTVIQDALTFHLNRLSPGETADADVLAVCLRALNHVADEWNGKKSFLFREVLTASGSAISAATAALGTAWATLSPGDEILGASYNNGSTDVPLDPLTMAQYQALPVKTTAGEPLYFAHDGLATVYLYPVPTSSTVTLRTKQAVSDFADLDTEYSMPKGYSSALSACVSELLAPTMAPATLADCQRKAKAARSRLLGQAMEPAILNATGTRWSVETGWW